MKRVILDTNVLGVFLRQYFSTTNANRGKGRFVAEGNLSPAACGKINTILDAWKADLPLQATVVIPPITLFELLKDESGVILPIDLILVTAEDALAEQLEAAGR